MPIKYRDGLHRVSVTVDGRRVRKAFKDPEEAKRWEASARAFLMNGGQPSDINQISKDPQTAVKGMTLEALFEKTLETRWRGKPSEVTATINSKSALQFFGRTRAVRSITPAAFLEYKAHLKKKRLAVNTVNRKLSALGTMLKVAETLGVIDRAPKVPKDKEPEGRTRYFTPEELEITWDAMRALARIHSNPMYLEVLELSQFLLETGCRVGEALKLVWTDFQEDWVFFRKTKSGKSRRIPLTSKAEKIILERHKRFRSSAGPFMNIDQGNITHVWQTVVRELNVDDPEWVPHTLRHTCASRLIQRGMSPKMVQEWLGHKTIQQTMRYSHLSPDQMLDCRNILEGF